MRIVIAGPPKTGNTWAKCLLSEAYSLTLLNRPPKTIDDLGTRLEEGWFKDNTIFHQHLRPEATLIDMMDSVDAKLVTVLRNPYDTFVSLYFFVQNFPKLFRRPEHQLHSLREKPIDDPDVLEFLRQDHGGFGVHLLLALKWLESGKSTIMRYESLKANPLQELKKATDQLSPLEDEKLEAAIEACSVQKMRTQKKSWSKHVRKGSVGDWRNHLTEVHLEIFRDCHGELIEKLGYEVM
jgi:hypothetical protein